MIDTCQCEYRKDQPTYAKGFNIIGQEVECKGWDVVCEKCGFSSWLKNNEKENNKEEYENK